MFKFILGIVVGIAAMYWLSGYTLVKVSNNASTNEVKIVNTQFIPDSWKSTVDTYWKEKQNNEH